MKNTNKNIFFTFVSFLVMIEMFIFDLIYMGDKRVILFKIIGTFVMAWFVDVVYRGIKKRAADNSDSGNIFKLFIVSIDYNGAHTNLTEKNPINEKTFTEKTFASFCAIYLCSLLICSIIHFAKTDLGEKIFSLNMVCSWLVGFFLLLCARSFKRWRKTRDPKDLFFRWPYNKQGN